jgi:DNA-binding NarL/FixJ family response regulator
VGAHGYLLKDSDEIEIVRAVRAVANGKALFNSAIADRILKYFASPSLLIPKDIFPELSD